MQTLEHHWKKCNKLRSFHHNTSRKILKIIWCQVCHDLITNRKIWLLFCNILNIDSFIIRRTCMLHKKISPDHPKISTHDLPKCLEFINSGKMAPLSSHHATMKQQWKCHLRWPSKQTANSKIMAPNCQKAQKDLARVYRDLF